MKKITLFLALIFGVASTTTAQISTPCQNTCEVEKIVQKDAFLGVKIYGIKTTSHYHGVYIKQVLPNTAAEKFGFNERDIIESVDGVEVYSTKEMVKLIATYEPSDLVSIIFKRNGKEYDKDVILGAKTTTIEKETICCDDKDPFFNDVNITLFPNPTVSDITIDMNEAEAGKYTFQVFNTIGEEVLFDVQSFDSSFSKNMDLKDLSSGEYFLKISKNSNTITKAFIISK